MCEHDESDNKKIIDAIQCMKKTIQCTLCHKIPTEPTAAKCGHPFCKACINKVLDTKRPACAICKSGITRSGLYDVKHITKINEDLSSLFHAVETDLSSTCILINKQPAEKQCEGKSKNFDLPGPSTSKITGRRDSKQSNHQHKRRISIDSQETIKIPRPASSAKDKIVSPSLAPSITKTAVNQIISVPVFTSDNLSSKDEAIEPKNKVDNWLKSQEFTDVNEDEEPEFTENVKPQSPDVESFARAVDDSYNSDKNRRMSRTRNRSAEKSQRDNSSSTDNGSRFRSFTTDALNLKRSANRKFLTQSEKIFDEVLKSSDELNDKRKARDASVLTDGSWSDIALLKKEARPRVRKRKKLNISIERPSTSKSVARESEERENEEESMEKAKNKSNERMNITPELTSNKKHNLIRSSRILGESEMFDFKNLSRQEVKDIIGISCTQGYPETSKISDHSLDKSTPKSNKRRLSLNISNGENSNKEGESSRVQSKLSFHHDNSRPGSRLSSERFRLSSKRRSGSPDTSPSKLSVKLIETPLRDEGGNEKIELSHDTAVRSCNDYMKNRLSTKRLSSDSSRASVNVSMKKLGKLCKTRKKFKFLRLGSITSDLPRIKSVDTMCDAETQTCSSLLDSYFYSYLEQRDAPIRSNPGSSRIVTETRNATASIGKISESNESSEELDTVNEVNMLSPEKDSQLKFLATESPSVPRTNIPISDQIIETSNSQHNNETKAVKNWKERLSVTDSEDQDTPTESIGTGKRKNICEAENNRLGKRVPSAPSFGSKSTSTLSDLKINDNETKASTNRNIIITNNSTSLSNLERNSPRPSPRRGKYSLNLYGSQTKRLRSAEKRKSLSNSSRSFIQNSEQSDTESLPHNKSKSKEDSEASGTTVRHRVVRQLKYSQESASKSNSNLSAQPEKKKTFNRILRRPSTDSENDSLEISLPTKQSSSNSQTISRQGSSREVNQIPILTMSEEMSVEFSSNKDTQEYKRKRSPSPLSLDNNALQAIASAWSKELDHSSEEINATHENVLGKSKNPSVNEARSKKPRNEILDSPNSDDFPTLSPTAVYGSRRNGKNTTERTEDSTKIDTLQEVPQETFEDVNAARTVTRNCSFTSPKNKKTVSRILDKEISINRGNASIGIITSGRNSIPIKAKSLEDRNLSTMRQMSYNSDKENVVKENLNKLRSNGEKSEVEKTPVKWNQRKTVSGIRNSAINTQPLDSSFDREMMNITQEELLLKEVENNLLGNNDKESAEKSPSKTVGKKYSPAKGTAIDNVIQKSNGYKVAEIQSDDSDTLDEEIVERTPEKTPLSKKEQLNSQRSNLSRQSFMSVDITPITKKLPKMVERLSEISPLVEQSSKLKLSNNSNISVKNTRLSYHSTPKATTSGMKNQYVTQKSGKRFCFVCSSLSLPQIQNVKEFAAKYNAEYTADYKPGVTHVIVNTDETNCAGRTLKYLLGVVKKNWIVSYRWVEESTTKGRMLDEEPYEAFDADTEEPGPRKSRLSKVGLFEDFAFVCMRPFNDITVDQLQELLISTGGTVMKSLEDLAVVPNKLKVILYNSDIHELSVLENWQRRGSALPVHAEWVLTCISQYDHVSFCEYLQNIDPKTVLELGFPPQFIIDEHNSSNDS